MLTDKYDRIKVGRRIKRLRQAQELTVQELAARSKVSAGYVSEIERGLSTISVDKLMQIAEGLGIGMDTLLEELPEDAFGADMVRIPAALSVAAERLNLSHRATLLPSCQGQQSIGTRDARRQNQASGPKKIGSNFTSK